MGRLAKPDNGVGLTTHEITLTWTRAKKSMLVRMMFQLENFCQLLADPVHVCAHVHVVMYA